MNAVRLCHFETVSHWYGLRFSPCVLQSVNRNDFAALALKGKTDRQRHLAEYVQPVATLVNWDRYLRRLGAEQHGTRTIRTRRGPECGSGNLYILGRPEQTFRTRSFPLVVGDTSCPELL